jgi:hypothetical protein
MNRTNDPALKNMTAECRQTFIDTTEKCKEQAAEFGKVFWSELFLNPLRESNCTSNDKSAPVKACASDQKQKSFGKICPSYINFTDCFNPAMPCIKQASPRSWDSLYKQLDIECASYKNGDSQGLSFMMPWTIFLLFLF